MRRHTGSISILVREFTRLWRYSITISCLRSLGIEKFLRIQIRKWTDKYGDRILTYIRKCYVIAMSHGKPVVWSMIEKNSTRIRRKEEKERLDECRHRLLIKSWISRRRFSGKRFVSTTRQRISEYNSRCKYRKMNTAECYITSAQK